MTLPNSQTVTSGITAAFQMFIEQTVDGASEIISLRNPVNTNNTGNTLYGILIFGTLDAGAVIQLQMLKAWASKTSTGGSNSYPEVADINDPNAWFTYDIPIKINTFFPITFCSDILKARLIVSNTSSNTNITATFFTIIS